MTEEPGLLVESVLKEISEVVSSIDDSQSVLESLVHLVTRMLQVQKCSLMILDREAGELRIRAAHGIPPDVVRNCRIPLGEGIAGWVAREGKPLLIQDLESHPIFGRPSAGRYATTSLLSVPLRFRGEVMGVLNVNNKLDDSVFEQGDEFLLTVVANFAVIALDKARLREIEAGKARMDAEMRTARRIQEGMLPRHFPVDRAFEYAARSLPAQGVAGDFYDFVSMADGSVTIVLGDVCGKGMGAALNMARVISYFRAAAREHKATDKVMSFVNKLVASEWVEQNFVTATLLHLDDRRGTLSVSSAGHQAPLLRCAVRAQVLEVPVDSGLPLGVREEEEYSVCTLDFQKDDIVLAYSDGVTEARDSDDQLFGDERFLEVVRSGPSRPEKLVETVANAVFSFAGTRSQSDDLTIVAVRKRQ